jgi:acyl-coenzyme A thioesterase PaaI-like protein
MLLKETALLRLLGLRIPTFLFLGPRVERLDDDGCEVLIPLNWRTGNHLIRGMYFGALCAGADLAAGLNAARLILSRHRDVRLVFGDIHGEFLKRADGDVLFRARDGRRVSAAVREAVETGERVTLDPPVEVVALVPKKYGEEPVARFRLTMSLKRQGAAGGKAERVAAPVPPRKAS